MISEDRVRAGLESVDWRFTGSWTGYGVHGLHWYPATYVPQLPAFLIELLTKEEDVLLDPFCGVGTTLVEALRLGRRCVGLDANPIAVMIARAKTTLFDEARVKALQAAFLRKVEATRTGESELFRNAHNATYLESDDSSGAGRWFHAGTYGQLRMIWEHILKEDDADFRHLARVVFSQILKGCCSQRRHWGYIADNVAPKALVFVDAFEKFAGRLENAVNAVVAFRRDSQLGDVDVEDLNRRSLVLHGDARGLPARTGRVDAIITSPPYVNVTDYARSQRLSMEWFGYDTRRWGRAEMGARWKRFRNASKEEYIGELHKCLCECRRVLRPGGFLAIVLDEGRRRWPDVLKQVRDILRDAGFRLVGHEVTRQYTRQRVLDHEATVNREAILVMR